MKNGFTLIELLAVIVILAIIALIATPIILEIIKDSKEESNKRSIEMYAKALQNSIAKYQLDGKNLEVSKLETTDGRNFSNINDFKVDYDGNVVCDIIEIYEDGDIYLDKCKVDNIEVEYSYGIKVIPEPVSFASDSWATIAKAIREGNTSMYKVGDTKEVSLQPTFINQEENSNGLYTVRIANISSSDKVCTEKGNSETACGFVLEFVDIITTHNMNPVGEYKGVQYSVGWNVDGYPKSSIYAYIKNDVFNSLPEDLKDVIINTNVVSSHGNTSGESNFISNDKLYLLSTKEVYGKEGTIDEILGDTAESETRQLDYYKNQGVTTSNYSDAIKKYKDSVTAWWLRSSYSGNFFQFYYVNFAGLWHIMNARNDYGVSPAFRIG